VARLTLKGIRKCFGEATILQGVDLDAPDGSLVVLVGPSGCGKSTLLRTVAGLEAPDAGTVTIGDRDVTKLPPKDRDIAMVFQSYALYPHLRVRDNLSFGLKLRGADRALIERRVREVAQMLDLDALLDRYPRQLSGGQRQRVAMGRAIARRPSLFLFDEPLSNLDAALRAEVRVEIKKLHDALGATMLYVTHDQVEAMTLADVLVVLRAGHIEQRGAPLELYESPATRFVAAFIGSPSMNFIEAEIADGRVRAEGLLLDAPSSVRPGSILVGIRPHDLVQTADGTLALRVDVVEAMGFETYAHGELAGAPFVARLEGSERPRRGDRIRLAVERFHLFDPNTGRALGRSSG